MAAKKRLRMRGVKQPPKRLEGEILERSKKLADDPGILRPLCAGNCRKCAFDKPFKNIEAISQYKNDADTLLKLASRGGDDLAKAYAGTISLSAAGKIPMLATATIAGEKVPYAVRGVVGNDKLIGCQYYNDPKIRLLYYNIFVKKNKLHLYSFEEGLVCSDSPNMPEDYLYERFWDTPYEFKDDGLTCGHEGAIALNIRIKSLNEEIHICDECAKDVSTIQYLISQICAVDPLDDFEVEVQHKYHNEKESGKEKIEGTELKKYLKGEINDRILLQTIKRSKLGDLKSSDVATYIIGATNYGSDLGKFMADVTGPESEKATIEKYLTKKPASLILKNGKTTEILAILWDDNWREIVATHTSEEVAGKLTERPRCPPSQVLSDAYDIFISADIVAALPEFKKPGPRTKLMDNMAKAAKVGGADMALKAMANENLKNKELRSITSAFVLACDPNAKLPITLTPEEKDYTDFLIPFAKQVIDSTGDKYREDMNTLLTATSSGESV